MREFDGKGSASAPPIKVPEIPERTLEQRQQDAIAEAQRHVSFADHWLSDVRRVQDPREWKAKHVRLEEQLVTSAAAFEKAKELDADADTLGLLQTRIATLRRAAAEAKPPKEAELALESEIY